MARIRTIKPEFWSSEQVMECQPLTRLLFIGIWNFCDDGGNHPDSEKTIKARVFPGDEISSSSIRRMLDELSSNGLLAFYEHSGKRYLHVCGWEHQRIDKPTFKYPEFVQPPVVSSPPLLGAGTDDNQKPGPGGDSFGEPSTSIRLPLDESSSNPRLALDPGREGMGNRKGEEQDQEQVVANAPAPAQAETAPGKKSKRGTRLPADWIAPDDWLSWAQGERPELDDRMLKAMADSFKDYWVSKSGANATKLDWEATWRNWVRNQRLGNQRASPSSTQSNYVDLDKIDHTEGLVRQPDGTYRVAKP
ncbi:hypothetical protein [Pseudomonas veronii]|uniref:hypothetical protein n=1 Tax=Pseudomonas veronii TaxID=76761 RepID=UPI0021CCFEBD|nr:hypothetical protein [Pseudomonas veronii]